MGACVCCLHTHVPISPGCEVPALIAVTVCEQSFPRAQVMVSGEGQGEGLGLMRHESGSDLAED